MGIGGSQVECRRKQNACEMEEGAATVTDPEEEPLNESMDIQTTIYTSHVQIPFAFLPFSRTYDNIGMMHDSKVERIAP